MPESSQILAWVRYLERTAPPQTKGAYGLVADGIERGEFRRFDDGRD
jgi:hypothetical protein